MYYVLVILSSITLIHSNIITYIYHNHTILDDKTQSPFKVCRTTCYQTLYQQKATQKNIQHVSNMNHIQPPSQILNVLKTVTHKINVNNKVQKSNDQIVQGHKTITEASNLNSQTPKLNNSQQKDIKKIQKKQVTITDQAKHLQQTPEVDSKISFLNQNTQNIKNDMNNMPVSNVKFEKDDNMLNELKNANKSSLEELYRRPLAENFKKLRTKNAKKKNQEILRKKRIERKKKQEEKNKKMTKKTSKKKQAKNIKSNQKKADTMTVLQQNKINQSSQNDASNLEKRKEKSIKPIRKIMKNESEETKKLPIRRPDIKRVNKSKKRKISDLNEIAKDNNFDQFIFITILTECILMCLTLFAYFYI